MGRPEEDQHIRELDDLRVVGANLDDLSPEGLDEELLLGLDIRRVQVMMAVHDWAVLGCQELAEGLGGRRQHHQNRHRQRERSFHLSPPATMGVYSRLWIQ